MAKSPDLEYEVTSSPRTRALRLLTGGVAASAIIACLVTPPHKSAGQELMARAVPATTIDYAPEPDGSYSASFLCDPTYDKAAGTWSLKDSQNYTATPLYYPVPTNGADVLIHAIYGAAEFEYNLDVSVKGTAATAQLYDVFSGQDTPQEVHQRNLANDQTLSGEYRLIDYAIENKAGQFVVAVACNEQAVQGEINFNAIAAEIDQQSQPDASSHPGIAIFANSDLLSPDRY